MFVCKKETGDSGRYRPTFTDTSESFFTAYDLPDIPFKTAAAAARITRKIRFQTVKTFRKAPFFSGYARVYDWKEIKLARDAMRVPRPPRFTAVSRAGKLSVNPDSRIAAGTLLITWLVSMPAQSSLPSTREKSTWLIPGIRFTFPINIKKQRNVSSRK